MDSLNNKLKDKSTQTRKHENVKVNSTLTLIEMLKKDFTIWKKFFSFYKLCNRTNLEKRKGIYKDYFFAKNNEIFDKAGFEKGEIAMLLKKEFRQQLLEREDKLNFDADTEAKKKVNEFVGSLVDVKIDKHSENNFLTALVKSKLENKKLIIIGNHMSHMDAPIYNYIVQILTDDVKKKHKIDIEKIRFVCGAYMYYSKPIRHYNNSFDTTFVIGVNDIGEYIRFILENLGKEYLEKFEKEIQQTLLKNKEKEIMVLFPYGGRAKSDEGCDNGCKTELPKGIKKYFQIKDCVFLPMGLIGTENMMNFKKSLFGKHILDLKKSNISLNIGNAFEYDKNLSLEKINQIMHEVSNNALKKSKS